MNHLPRTVLFVDYNVIQAMLSGYSLISLVKHLDPARYRPFVLFNRSSDIQEVLEKSGVPTAIIAHGGGSHLTKLRQFGSLPISLRQLGKKIKPDIIHANNVMASRAAMVLRHLTGVPAVIHFRNIGMLPRLARWMWMADHFATVSNAARDGTIPPRLHDRTTVVWDGLDLTDYPPTDDSRRKEMRRILGLPADATIVGMAGRITEQKGVKYFAEAARRLTAARPDVAFAHIGKMTMPVAGSEIYEQEVLDITKPMREAGKFFWLDYTNTMSQFWSALDIAVAPSCGPEAFGRVLVEAMASEIPAVATPCGGPDEVIDAATGVLVPMADAPRLADAIARWLDDPAERRQVGQAARRRVQQLFSAEAYAQRVMAMYDKILR